MQLQTPVCELLGIDYPILQGALGPNGTAKLASAVSNAGGLGTVSTGGTSITAHQAKQHIKDQIERTTELTDNNFAANSPVGSLDMAYNKVKIYDVYIDTILQMKQDNPAVDEQLKLLITSGGNPDRLIDRIAEVKDDTDLLHFHKVGKVKHAEKAADLGVDGVIAAGFEMGSHTHHPDNAVHTFVLIPQVAAAVDIPVIAAGGMKDGRSLLATLAFGADGISMGTRFLTTAESEFAAEYKQYIVNAEEGQDRVLATGRPARVLESPALAAYEEMIESIDMDEFTEVEEDRALAAQNSGNVDKGLIWSGQIGCYIDDVESVEDVIQSIVDKAGAAYADLGPLFPNVAE